MSSTIHFSWVDQKRRHGKCNRHRKRRPLVRTGSQACICTKSARKLCSGNRPAGSCVRSEKAYHTRHIRISAWIVQAPSGDKKGPGCYQGTGSWGKVELSEVSTGKHDNAICTFVYSVCKIQFWFWAGDDMVGWGLGFRQTQQCTHTFMTYNHTWDLKDVRLESNPGGSCSSWLLRRSSHCRSGRLDNTSGANALMFKPDKLKLLLLLVEHEPFLVSRPEGSTWKM